MPRKKVCAGCGEVVPPARVRAIPATTTCVGCSKVPKVVGFLDYGHKTAPGLVVIDPRDEEALRRARRYNRRAR